MANNIKMKDLVRGNTRKVNCSFVDDTGIAINLTGASVWLVATTDATPPDDTDAAINFGPVTVHTNPTAGLTSFILPAATTRIAPNTYNVGVQAVLADGTVVENTGKVKVVADYKVATS